MRDANESHEGERFGSTTRCLSTVLMRVFAWEDPTPVTAGRVPRILHVQAVQSIASIRSLRSGHGDWRPPRVREKITSLPALLRRLDEIWRGLQVSRRGAYSGVRMQSLHRYEANTPLWRVVLVLLLTPVPSLAFVVTLHCLHLQSPSLGWHRNTTFWCSLAVKLFVMSLSFVGQLKQVVPELPITNAQTIAVSVLTTVGHLTFLLLVSACWIFPVPFAVVWPAPILIGLLLLFVGLVIGKQARSRLPKLRLRARVYAHIVAVQGVLVIAYPVYNAIFVGLSPMQQTFFVVMPSIMKFGLKNLLCDACAPLPLDDELPELLVFTVDLFNAIYLTACMQSANASVLTAFVIFIIGTGQLTLAVRTLLQRAKNIRNVIRQLRSHTMFPVDTPPTRRFTINARHPTEQLTAIGVRLCFQRGHRSSVTRTAINGKNDIKTLFANVDVKPSGHTAVGRKAAIVVPSQLLTIGPEVVSAQARERLVEEILKTLFTCEYLILAEYVKCVIPLLSMVHTIVLYHLPAKEFYLSMQQYTSTKQLFLASEKVLLFLILQLLAVAVLGLLLQRQLRHSILYHLAFVLERNGVMIQMRLFTWVTLAFLLPMAHVGADYTFKFEWIKYTHE